MKFFTVFIMTNKKILKKIKTYKLAPKANLQIVDNLHLTPHIPSLK